MRPLIQSPHLLSTSQWITSLLSLIFSALIGLSAHAETFKIKGYSDAEVARLELSDGEISISYQEGQSPYRLSAKRNQERRTYQDAFGVVVAKIKSKGSGFKLYGVEGRTLFKVKMGPDRVKIIISGQESQPLKIKSKGDRFKVYRVYQDQQNPIGQVKLSEDQQKVKVKDAAKSERFRIRTTRLSPAFGILLDDRIEAKYRYVLMMEILLRQFPSIAP